MLNLTNEAKILISIAIVTIALLFGGVWWLNQESIPAVIDTQLLIRSDSFKTGTGSEKVTIVEFADFQCPACRAASTDLGKIATDYDGQVNIIYRHFPLSQHQYARVMASFAEAAGEQGKFWEAYKKLFDSQNEWSNATDIKPFIDQFTKELALDPKQVAEVMNSQKTSEKIQQDYDDGVKVGVSSTPTIFLNGEKLNSFPTYDLLKQKIEEKLNNK